MLAKLRYCTLCKRNVEAKKGFNWLVFIFLLGVPYLLFHMLFKRRRCPMCKSSHYLQVAQF
jgi:hypothetical protein